MVILKRALISKNSDAMRALNTVMFLLDMLSSLIIDLNDCIFLATSLLPISDNNMTQCAAI